jgi:hypothetical protein
VLYSNYRWGDPKLHRLNTFLLAFFVARLLFYFTLYGQFDLDLMVFTGTVGLSLSLNGGVSRRKAPTRTGEKTTAAAEVPDAVGAVPTQTLLPDARRA